MQVLPLKEIGPHNPIDRKLDLVPDCGCGKDKLAKRFFNSAILALLCSLILIPISEARISSIYLAIFLTLLGGAIGLTRFKFLVVASAWLLASCYAILSLTPATKYLAPHFISRDELPSQADAIIVLSAESPYSNFVKSQALERLLHGKSLLDTNIANSLVLTDLPWYRGNPEKDRQFILGEASEKVIAVGPVENTYDEAKALKRLALEHGWKRIILVTSPLHSRRAKAIFLEQLPELIVISSPSPTREFDLNLLITSYDKLKVSRLMLYEVAAWGKNFILGRL